MINYSIIFLLGGTLFTTLYHYCKNNNTIFASLIPAFPTLFLFGLLTTIYFNGNILAYIKNSSLNFFLTFSFCMFLYLTFLYSKNIIVSLITILAIYLLVIKKIIEYKFLK